MILTFSNNKARINEKKGADGGIDGVAYFAIDAATNCKAIFQVKSGKTGRKDVAIVNSDRLRERAEFSYLITFDEDTAAMRNEVAEIGKYKHPYFDREDDRIQVIYVAEILRGKRLDLPMTRDAVKAAAAAHDAEAQGALL